MSTCTKRGYRSRAQASAALESIRRRGERHDGKKPTRVYLCERCKRWHLTSEAR